MIFFTFFLGIVLGVAVTFFFYLQKVKLLKEQLTFFEKNQAATADHFKGMSSDALKHNNETFLQLAEKTFEKFHALKKE